MADPAIPANPTIEELVREELSEWETFTASDGNTSIRMKAPRSTEAVVRAIVAKARRALYHEAAEVIINSEHLRSLTDDHMGDIEMAACELRRLAQVPELAYGLKEEPNGG